MDIQGGKRLYQGVALWLFLSVEGVSEAVGGRGLPGGW